MKKNYSLRAGAGRIGMGIIPYLAGPFVLFSLAAQAPHAPLGDVFQKDGYAIGGYDPVAYFTVGKPQKGSKEFGYDWNGATWLFASAEHQQLFQQQPQKYAPAYGGYCAYAIGVENEKVGINPKAWTIHQGRLYLNYSSFIRLRWKYKMAEYIELGDKNWAENWAAPPAK